jgi:hypothetical protein
MYKRPHNIIKTSIVAIFLLLFAVGFSAAQDTDATTVYLGSADGNFTHNFSSSLNVSEMTVNITAYGEDYDYHIDKDLEDVYIKDSWTAGQSRIYTIENTTGYSPNGTAVYDFFDDFDSTLSDYWTTEGTAPTIANSQFKYSGGTTTTRRATGEDRYGTGNITEFYAEIGMDDGYAQPGMSYESVQDRCLIVGRGDKTKHTYDTYNNGALTTANADGTYSDFHTWGIQYISTSSVKYTYDGTVEQTTTTNVPDTDMNLVFWVGSLGGTDYPELYVDYIRVRQYTANEPTVSVTDMGSYYEVNVTSSVDLTDYQVPIPCSQIGVTSYSDSLKIESASATEDLTVNVTVTGDSDTIYYINGSATEVTLNPTENISSVFFNPNATGSYDYNITLHWSEVAAVYEETLANGYANFSITYTPQENITSGIINATYNQIDFSNQSYVGSPTGDIDGTPVTVYRDDQRVYTEIEDMDTTTHYINFSVLYNPAPEVYTPTGTYNFTFPPLNHEVSASWEDTTGIYEYYVTTQGGTYVTSDTVTTNTASFEIPAGDYYFYVRAYDEPTEEWSAYSTLSSFTVVNDYGITNTTAVVGIVYEYDEGQVPVGNAIVHIYNDTWSDSEVVGSDGFYSFLNLAPNETYNLQATKQDYASSFVQTITTVNNSTVQQDILLHKETTYYNPHYVRYVVKDIWGTKYQDVNVNVYKGDAVTAVVYLSGVTGSDGTVTFRLDENEQYTLTFVKESDGIDETLTMYPKKDEYTVYVISQTLEPDDTFESEEIDISVTKNTINSSHAYINITYLDNINETTVLNVWLNQSNTANLTDQTLIDSYYSTGESNASISFIVEDYAGQSYFVNVEAAHSTFDSVKRSYAVSFDGMADSHGFGSIYVWLGIGAIMFSGAIFKATTARQGAFIVCVVAASVTWLGFFDNLGSTAVLAIKGGTTLGFVIALAALLAKGEKEN